MRNRRIFFLLSILSTLFLLGSISYSWYEYTLLMPQLNKLTLAAKTPAAILLRPLTLGVVAVAVSSLVTVLLLLLGGQSGEATVVYVRKNETEARTGEEAEAAGDSDGASRDLARIEDTLQQAGDFKQVMERVLTSVCHELEASQAAFFVAKRYEGRRVLELSATYAYHIAESKTFHYEFGEGLAGQVAKEAKQVNIRNIPPGYITILSGLGKAAPAELVVSPVSYEGEVVGVLEIASFRHFTRADEQFIEGTSRLVGTRLTNRCLHEEVASLAGAPSLAAI